MNKLVELTNRGDTLNNNGIPEGELQEEENSTRSKLENSSSLDVEFKFIKEYEVSIQNKIINMGFILFISVLVEELIGERLNLLIPVSSHNFIKVLISRFTILGNPFELDPGE